MTFGGNARRQANGTACDNACAGSLSINSIIASRRCHARASPRAASAEESPASLRSTQVANAMKAAGRAAGAGFVGTTPGAGFAGVIAGGAVLAGAPVFETGGNGFAAGETYGDMLCGPRDRPVMNNAISKAPANNPMNMNLFVCTCILSRLTF